MREIIPLPRRTRSTQAGLTLLELILACAILMILASSAMPIARFTVKRQKEAELHRDLREMRDAIDRYKDASDRNLIQVAAGSEGYPPDLQTLVSGVDLSGPTTQSAAPAVSTGTTGGTAMAFGGLSPQTNSASTAGTPAIRHVRFLRRIPIDPMTGRMEWGLRSVQDDSDSKSWGGQDVFDVYSQSTDTALDNTKYSDW